MGAIWTRKRQRLGRLGGWPAFLPSAVRADTWRTVYRGSLVAGESKYRGERRVQEGGAALGPLEPPRALAG